MERLPHLLRRAAGDRCNQQHADEYPRCRPLAHGADGASFLLSHPGSQLLWPGPRGPLQVLQVGLQVDRVHSAEWCCYSRRAASAIVQDTIEQGSKGTILLLAHGAY